MKKINLIIVSIISIIFICLNLIGCSENKETNNSDITKNTIENSTENTISSSKKIKITTTIFPIYDYVKNIMGELFTNDNVVMLFDNGIDLHNYQLSVGDMVKIESSDLFIYVGGESDEKWVPRALEKVKSKDKSLNLLVALGNNLRYEKDEEWMDDKENEDSDEANEADEHIWLSIKNSKIFTQVIADKLSEIDNENKDIYQKNASSYIEKLNALENKFIEVTNNKKVDTIVFGDRFPFRYLFDDLGLNYYMAFNGCSAETEASFKTIKFLSDKVDEYNLNYVVKLTKSTNGIAKTIVANTKNKNQKIVEMASCENVFNDALNSGVSYISLMEENLQVLKEVLEN